MSFELGHALLIGIGAHTDGSSADEPIMVADAQAIASVLRDDKLCGYPADQVQVLHGVSATRENILAALDRLAARTSAADTVFLFYSGHGTFSSDGSYNLLCFGAGAAEQGALHAGVLHTDALRTDAFSAMELADKLRDISAEHIFMAFNASHIGSQSTTDPTQTASEHLPATSNPPEEVVAALLLTGKGRVVMTACPAGQPALIGNGLLTPFTQALFDGLRGNGVRDSQGYISTFGLHEYVYETVTDTVQQAYGAQQEPQLFLLRGTEPFAVALYRGRGATSFGEDLEDELPPHAGVHELDLNHLNHAPAVHDAVPVLQDAAPGNSQRRVLPADVIADIDSIVGSVSADDLSVAEDEAATATYHQATAPDRQRLVDILKELRRAIQTSDLSDEQKTDAFAGLAEVDNQLTQAQPDFALMQNLLNSVRESMLNAGPTAETAQSLAQQALAAAQREYQ